MTSSFSLFAAFIHRHETVPFLAAQPATPSGRQIQAASEAASVSDAGAQTVHRNEPPGSELR